MREVSRAPPPSAPGEAHRRPSSEPTRAPISAVPMGSGAEILPAFWDDNYFELLPDEQREIRVTYPRGSSHTTPIVTADAWNTAHASE